MQKTMNAITFVVGLVITAYFAQRLVGQGATLLPIAGFFFGAMALGGTISVWQLRRSIPGPM